MIRKIIMVRSAILLSALCVPLTGCDGLIPTWQAVRVQVLDVHSKNPKASAEVTLAAKFRVSRWDERDEELLNRVGHSAVTDSNGVASVDLEILALPGGISLSRDRVTNMLYLVRVRCDGAEETIAARLKRGLRVDGDVFRVAILDVGKPRRRR